MVRNKLKISRILAGFALVQHILWIDSMNSFIWSAFILQDMGETTRLTNGCIESYFGSRKNNAPKRISRKPAQYTTYVYPLIKGLCIRFNEKENVKKMRKKDNDAKNNESLDEVAAVEAEEGYNKPIKTDSTVRSILKQPKLGFYQKAPVIKKKTGL